MESFRKEIILNEFYPHFIKEEQVVVDNKQYKCIRRSSFEVIDLMETIKEEEAVEVDDVYFSP